MRLDTMVRPRTRIIDAADAEGPDCIARRVDHWFTTQVEDVFMSIGTPLRRSNARSNAWKIGFEADVTIWTRADPSALRDRRITDFFSARTGCTASM